MELGSRTNSLPYSPVEDDQTLHSAHGSTKNTPANDLTLIRDYVVAVGTYVKVMELV